MAHPSDPRHDAPAADADILGDDARFGASVDPALEAAPTRGAGGTAAPVQDNGAAARGAGLRRDSATPVEPGEAPSGADINQPGFVKDPGATKP